MNFFFNQFLTYIPGIFYGAVFIIALLLFFLKNKFIVKFSLASKFFVLAILTIGFRLLYAVLLTASQYYIWSRQEFTKFLLPPTQPIKYFVQYSFTHFWIGTLISIGAAIIFYLFLRLLWKYQQRFFEKDEIVFGFLMTLIIGWPNFVVFAPLAFVLTILISLIRTLILGNVYTDLYPSLILAGLLVSLLGDKIVDILGLTALRI